MNVSSSKIIKLPMNSLPTASNQVIRWNEQLLTVTFIGESQILFHTEDDIPVQLSLLEFQALIQKNAITIFNQI